ncbi:carboxypeptidase-like regulatory domain-containing protein [Gimesia sp.]|uniref:carboxypeptidase-like regulatory domain-containing protein n=1 Tax=Gimesia sp. TaxID=2024833 RepID=UPI0025C704EB|nr:carboxypeptidase-like regulatory domain-containing protein [Gimesia sp.]
MKPFVCMKFSLLPLCLFAGLLLSAGCGGSINADYSQLDLVDVSGTVTLDGQPLSGATVAFEAADGTYSSGVTDAGGHYSLMFNTEKSGCLTGQKTVRIKFVTDSEAPEGEAETEGAEQPSTAASSKIPEQYNQKSTLTATVDADHTSFNFELKSRP